MDLKGYNTCVVCQETSDQVALHYARMLCNGCRAFFKRTVQGKVKVTECKAEGKCVMDQNSRKNCKACRYDACMKAGVDSSKVQQPRENGHDNGTDGQDLYHNLNDSRDFDSPATFVPPQQFMPKPAMSLNEMQTAPLGHMPQHLSHGVYSMPPVINLHVPSIGIGVFNQHPLPASPGNMMNTAPYMSTCVQNSYGNLPPASSHGVPDKVGSVLRPKPVMARAPTTPFDLRNGMALNQHQFPSASFGQYQSTFDKISPQMSGHMSNHFGSSNKNLDLLRYSNGTLGSQATSTLHPWATTSFAHPSMHAPLPLVQPSVTEPYYYPMPKTITYTHSFIDHAGTITSLPTLSQTGNTPVDLSSRNEMPQTAKLDHQSKKASQSVLDSTDQGEVDSTAGEIMVKEEILDVDDTEIDTNQANDKAEDSNIHINVASHGNNGPEPPAISILPPNLSPETRLQGPDTLAVDESKQPLSVQTLKEQPGLLSTDKSNAFMIDSLLKPAVTDTTEHQLKTLQLTSALSKGENQCPESTTFNNLYQPPLPYQGHYEALLSWEQTELPVTSHLPPITQFLAPTDEDLEDTVSDMSMDEDDDQLLSGQDLEEESSSQQEEINVVDVPDSGSLLLPGQSEGTGDSLDTNFKDVYSTVKEPREDKGPKTVERKQEDDDKGSKNDSVRSSHSDENAEKNLKEHDISMGFSISAQGDSGCDSGLGNSGTLFSTPLKSHNIDNSTGKVAHLNIESKDTGETQTQTETKEPEQQSTNENKRSMHTEIVKIHTCNESNNMKTTENDSTKSCDANNTTVSKPNENSVTPQKKRKFASIESDQHTNTPPKRLCLSDDHHGRQNLIRQSPRKRGHLKVIHENKQKELENGNPELQDQNKPHASECKTPFSMTKENMVPNFTSTPIEPLSGDKHQDFCKLMLGLAQFLTRVTNDNVSKTDEDTPTKTLVMSSSPSKTQSPVAVSSLSPAESGISSPEHFNTPREKEALHASENGLFESSLLQSGSCMKEIQSRLMSKFLHDDSYTVSEFRKDVLTFYSMNFSERQQSQLDGSYQDI